MPTGHTAYSVSALDLRMILAVPPGGNWKNIPHDVPSKRLEQIRKTGGRTTLYGRLTWNKPSFTITTYFNRPGNGCYIHPSQDRVLTSLEAARLQSFPDEFEFQGSKTSRTKQIGNAVPPLMAHAVAEQIRTAHPELHTTVDLFCGSGGLSLGFKWAGFLALAANDNFKDAALTFAGNNPEVPFILGDITDKTVAKDLLLTATRSADIDIVMGGPPCQGFSHAGYRMIDDPRNELYKNFVNFVKQVNPKVFVMENVEGILSISGGRTFQEIRDNFRKLGYEVEGRKLLATDFGVPQKRKRVFIMGSRIGLPSELFPKPRLTSDRYLSVRDAIGDIECSPTENIYDQIQTSEPGSPYQSFMQGKITLANLLSSF
jgi:DNA (cytosine-5)-methyltransferase 1